MDWGFEESTLPEEANLQSFDAERNSVNLNCLTCLNLNFKLIWKN